MRTVRSNKAPIIIDAKYGLNVEPYNKLDKNVKEKRNSGLLKSSLLVSFYTGLSRVAGLLRDIVFARFIGAEALADVFFVAFKIPNFFRRIFAEGAFSQAFVPYVLGIGGRGGALSSLRTGHRHLFALHVLKPATALTAICTMPKPPAAAAALGHYLWRRPLWGTDPLTQSRPAPVAPTGAGRCTEAAAGSAEAVGSVDS